MKERRHIIIKGRINEELRKTVLSKFNNYNNCTIFFVDYSNENILLNTEFTKCIINDKTHKINWKLVLITNQNFFKLNTIEKGYKTICGFKIHSKNNLLKEIPFMDNWYNEVKIKLEASHLPQLPHE